MIERLALFVFALGAASACAESKGPPPRVAEVPIDDGSPRYPTPASAPAEGGGAAPLMGGDPAGAFGLGGGAGGGAGAGAGAGGGAGAGAGLGGIGGLPIQLPTMTDVPAPGGGATAAAASGAKPLPPKAERLSAPECNKIMDRYIELVGVSQGISPDAISGVMTMLRNSVSGDANYTNALGACAKENTKTQYRCAMKAPDVDGWKKCLQ